MTTEAKVPVTKVELSREQMSWLATVLIHGANYYERQAEELVLNGYGGLAHDADVEALRARRWATAFENGETCVLTTKAAP